MRVIIEKQQDGEIIITPYGRIDTNSSHEFEEAALHACESAGDVIIDFSECEYVSSSGLRVLLKIKKSRAAEERTTLRGVNENIYEVLEITGFVDMFDIEKTETDHSDIKAIFFDIDGTLLSHTTGRVPESTKEAIRAAQEKGIKAVVATGRSWEELSKLPVMEIPFDGYLTLNGNICLGKDKTMFDGNEIDPGEVEILVSIFEAGRLPFVLIGEKQRYINYVDDVVIKTQWETHGTIPDIGEYNGEKIYQCLAFVDANTRRKLDRLLDQCIITSWNETGIDIIAKTGGKAAGIQKYLEAEGLKRSESMAFGDGENDLEMLKYVRVGVAMGNAAEDVKRDADYVTTSVDDDGIANAFRHFGLI